MDDTKRQKPSEHANWYVAYTNPRCEEMVAEAVKLRRFDSFVPAMTVTRQRKRVLRPLFPRYAFIGLRDGATLYSLRQTPGLGGLVRSSGQIVTVPSAVLTALWDAERQGEFVFTAEALARSEAEAQRKDLKAQIEDAFRDGKEVEICIGSFRYFKGQITAIHPNERMDVLIRICGRYQPIGLGFDQVKITGEGRGPLKSAIARARPGA